MRALVASCVFPPEPVVSAKTSGDVAVFFKSIGYETIVVCPKPTRNYQAEKSKIYTDPVKTYRLFSLKSNRSTFISRFMENISFGLSAFFHILFSKKYDVIYSNVWPVFATGLVAAAGKLRGSKVILSVQDLYPESLAQQSRVKSDSLIYRFLLWLDKKVSSLVDHIIVISERFHKAYSDDRDAHPEKLSIISNWIDTSKISSLEKKAARNQLAHITEDFFSDEKAFFIVYGGNIGVASGLDVLPELLDKLPSNIKFLIAGDGVLLKDLKRRISNLNYEKRVFFFSPWPESYTSVVFSSADLLFLPTAPGQSLVSVPSKLITYMLSGRPVFAVVDAGSDTAKEISRSQGGFVCPQAGEEAVSELLVRIADMPKEDLGRAGELAREYAMAHYSFESVKPKISNVLKRIYDKN